MTPEEKLKQKRRQAAKLLATGAGGRPRKPTKCPYCRHVAPGARLLRKHLPLCPNKPKKRVGRPLKKV